MAWLRTATWTAVFTIAALGPTPVFSQPICIDAVTGGWLNPWALVVASEDGKFSSPVVAHNFLDAGPVVGDLQVGSIAAGYGGDLEFGYSHYFLDGPTPVISTDLDAFSAKWNFLSAEGDRPAISAGITHRRSDDRDLSTTDLYIVGTRVFPSNRKGEAVLLNAGLRSSEASIYGIAGVSPDRELLAFGSAAWVLNSHVTVGFEVTQQPVTDTAYSTFVRFTPGKSQDLHIIVARAYVEDALRAESQLATGISYRF